MPASSRLAITGLGVLTSIPVHRDHGARRRRRCRHLLPAVLSLLGDRIDTGKLMRRHRPAKGTEDSVWWRFGHRVSGRPWPYLLGAVRAHRHHQCPG
jgi:RND superfamily putative drug exporter